MSKSRKALMRAKRRRKAMRTKLIWGGLGLIVLAALGLLVFQGAPPTVGEEVPVNPNYARHIEEGLDPGPFPSDPPAGGIHYAGKVDAGFYYENSPQAQVANPEGFIGHSMEHGYVIFWYNCADLSEGDCTTLKSDIESVMDDFNGLKLIAFPWPSLDIPLVMTSWGRLQRFEIFDPKTATEFIDTNRNRAPEAGAP